ncbi:MAG: nucleotidyltransferase domain-containing protein [Verrucomicrobia bacterium]|nr:nucleotidyltransferase domain-containing protein [Verrucomicrobiota bacterium]MBS0637935.1 nucleotidyltransferase domain-containing protein [Verrucomicrobiota bacterium]
MDREKLTKILQSDSDIAAALIFGSMANGTANRDSDIDIALLYNQNSIPEPLDMLQFRQQLSDSMHQEVDIVLLNTASPIIAMQAVKNGQPLVMRNQKAYDAFEMRLITDYADVKQMREPFEKNILQRKLHD